MSGPAGTYALFKVGAVWHYRYQINGRRVQRSTRETNARRADAIAKRHYEEARGDAVGSIPLPTLRQLTLQWLAINTAVVSSAHARAVDVFLRLHLYDLGDLPINAITTDLVEHARNLHLQDHAPASVNHWMTILKLVGNWAVKREVIPKLPWRVPMLKLQKRPRTILATDSTLAWLAAVDDAAAGRRAIATAIRLMFGLGLRESESSSARWEWLDWERKTYTPGITKGREADPVPVPAWLLEHLRPMRAVDGLIVRNQAGEAYGPGFARDVMSAANDACGTKGLTPHRLRGTYATMLSEAGTPIQTIQRVMRHKSPMTTMHYLETNMETAALSQERIAEKTNLLRRESGEPPPATPHQI